MDDYQILGIKPGTPVAEIRRAFVSRVKNTHPDATGYDTSSDFRQVAEAYKRLSRRRLIVRASVRPRPHPKPLEYPDFRSIRPAAHPTLPHDVQLYGARCILERQHVNALTHRDIARTIRVYDRNKKLVDRSFVIPRGTPHGEHLQYRGYQLKLGPRQWFDLQIVCEDQLTILRHNDV